MKRSEIFFGVLRLPLDAFATLSAFFLAYYIRPITDLIPGVQYHFYPELLPAFDEYLRLSVSATVFLLILFAFNHLYSLKVTEKFSKTFLRIGFLVSAWLMFIIAYYFLVVHQLFFSRIALAHIWIFTIIFVTLARLLILLIQSFLLRYGIGQRRVLFIGANPLADQCYHELQKDRRYKVIGTLAELRESRGSQKLKIIGTLESLESIVKRYGVEEIILAEPDLKGQWAADLHGFCRSNQINYHFIPDLVRLQRSNVDIEMLDNVPLISLKQTPLEGWGRVYKRIFDFVFSFLLIILLIPVWILVPIIIKLDSRGPAFYKSQRKYRDRTFNLFKFRTMVQGADKLKKDLIKENERKGPLFKIKSDPRVTKLGRFLRKTSIDELPQLFNVLLGSVSLVGPRPHLPEEVDQYESHHLQVFALKPGVTGLAQISGRSNLDFEEEVKLDVFYIENWSLWLDIKIIFKSIGVVFRADGC